MLPSDPVARKRTTTNKRGAAEISAVGGNITGKGGGNFGDKPRIGKTGMHLRWHEPKEFRELSKKQKKELFNCRKSRIRRAMGEIRMERVEKAKRRLLLLW